MSDQSPAAFARPRSADPEEFHNPETYHAQEGMTLRDYFAAKVVQACIQKDPPTEPIYAKKIAEYSYAMADHMLAERAK